jgi:transcriptional regulator with XRE-family HTH domain
MKESVMNNPGQYLKIIREKRGLGVKAVYSKTGVGDSTIRRIEEGKTKFPPAAQLKTLANFYGINLIELYKAYGYLDDIDIDCKNNCFENTELLSDDAVSHIQGLINLLTEKRTLK